ncbi:MAG TPA: hypothetical protein VGG39_17065 [Polyangiaceae bacterium]
MRRASALVVAAALSLGAVACGRSYAVAAAPGFVAIDKEQGPYQWRAVAPDGVAVAVRVVPLDDRADLPFWTHAVTLRMRESEGYALVGQRDVRSRDGTPGTELVFGHDESGKPFVYRVRLFLGKKNLYVVEAGGTKDQMARYEASVDWMLGSMKLL